MGNKISPERSNSAKSRGKRDRKEGVLSASKVPELGVGRRPENALCVMC